MRSRFALVPAISGRPAIGHTHLMAITGFPARGSWRPASASYGLQATGAGAAAPMSGMADTGDLASAFTAELTMGSDTWASAIWGDIGTTGCSPTTAR